LVILWNCLDVQKCGGRRLVGHNHTGCPTNSAFGIPMSITIGPLKLLLLALFLTSVEATTSNCTQQGTLSPSQAITFLAIGVAIGLGLSVGFWLGSSIKNRTKGITKRVEFKKLRSDALLPGRGSALSAGLDLSAIDSASLKPHSWTLIKTGLAVALPEGTYGRIAPRRGLALKFGLGIGAGVIDRDYRGEIGVILFNQSEKEKEIIKGDRIAQLILEKNEYCDPVEVGSLEETATDDKGFGSSGWGREIQWIPEDRMIYKTPSAAQTTFWLKVVVLTACIGFTQGTQTPKSDSIASIVKSTQGELGTILMICFLISLLKLLTLVSARFTQVTMFCSARLKIVILSAMSICHHVCLGGINNFYQYMDNLKRRYCHCYIHPWMMRKKYFHYRITIDRLSLCLSLQKRYFQDYICSLSGIELALPYFFLRNWVHPLTALYDHLQTEYLSILCATGSRVGAIIDSFGFVDALTYGVQVVIRTAVKCILRLSVAWHTLLMQIGYTLYYHGLWFLNIKIIWMR